MSHSQEQNWLYYLVECTSTVSVEGKKWNLRLGYSRSLHTSIERGYGFMAISINASQMILHIDVKCLKYPKYLLLFFFTFTFLLLSDMMLINVKSLLEPVHLHMNLQYNCKLWMKKRRNKTDQKGQHVCLVSLVWFICKVTAKTYLKGLFCAVT